MEQLIGKNNVQIVNWLLTRKCNLRCDYCGIVRESDKNTGYSDLKYYEENSMSPSYIIETLEKFKKYLPDCFHIFYGGEPLLYKSLDIVIKYCNDNNIYYTIITNNSIPIQPLIVKLLDSVGRLQGLTASIDPIIYDPIITDESIDRREKSLAGLKNLIKLSSKVDDMVAEITIDKSNVSYIYPLVKRLSDHNIVSSITFVDNKKSELYDFSNVTSEDELVNDSDELRILCDKMINEGLLIHMGEDLLDRTLNILPSNLDCRLEDYIHNLTIDVDGSIRLCLRIKGMNTPKYSIIDYFEKFDEIYEVMIIDKKKYCKLCNWTCPIISKLTFEENMTSELLHSEKRDI